MKVFLKGHRGAALVEVQVNHKREEWFLLDTGAERTVLYESAARRLGLHPLPTRGYVLDLGKGVSPANLAIAKTLSIAGGARQLSDLPVYILPDKDNNDAYVGILGMDFISKLGVFSLTASQLTLHRRPPLTGSYSPIPAVSRKDSIWFQLQLGKGQPISFVWDTGASVSYLSPNILPSQLRRRGGQEMLVPSNKHKIYIINSDNKREEFPVEIRKLWRFRTVSLGTISLHPFPVFQYQNSSSWPILYYGLLGFPLLTEFEILADISGGKFWARRYNERLAGTYGLSLFATESGKGLRWFFTSVVPTGEDVDSLPPSQTYEILAVDDVPTDRWETLLLVQRLMFPQARQACRVRYSDKRKIATTLLRAVGVPYLGMPLFYFHLVDLPRMRLNFEGGYLQSQLTLEIPRGVKWTRGARRHMQVRYRGYQWHIRSW